MDSHDSTEEREESNSEQYRDLTIFVGKNADYYERKFYPILDGSSGASWNWPAFLFTWIWLAYRKMYITSVCYLVIVFAAEWLFQPPVSMVAAIGSAICGVVGNHIYYLTSTWSVARIRAANVDSSMRSSELARRGGTSWRGALILLVVFLLLAWFLPPFSDPAPH
jgi:hypothetical protein